MGIKLNTEWYHNRIFVAEENTDAIARHLETYLIADEVNAPEAAFPHNNAVRDQMTSESRYRSGK